MNVTYMLGAGASFNALPIVSSLPKAINEVIRSLQSGDLSGILVSNRFGEREVRVEPNIIGYDQSKSLAMSNLQRLHDGCLNHMSIDTFAKMLYLTNDKWYDQMKATTVLFFELYRCLYPGLDKRYDAFLASIIQDKYDQLPRNVKVVSWNYDDQFERAYQRYLDNAGAEGQIATEFLNRSCKRAIRNDIDHRSFCLLKINGTAGFLGDDGEIHHLSSTSSQKSTHHQDIILSYGEAIQAHRTPALSFNWEKEEDGKLQATLNNVLSQTKVLVVIGYSFPFFNRSMDKEMFEIMRSIQKVYVQDPNADDLKERIVALHPKLKDNIFPVRSTDQFYLPNEL